MSTSPSPFSTFSTNQINRFADPRLGRGAHQSYFIGLAWSIDAHHLYAPIGSTSDPEGKKPGDTGNGIAVYAFDQGQITPERWIAIPPQPLAPGKKRGTIHHTAPDGKLIPWPAGIAVIKGDVNGKPGDQLLVADNLSDDVLQMDAGTGEIIHRFDVSTGDYVPSAYPCAVVAMPDATAAYVTLWNSPKIVRLDLTKGVISNWIEVSDAKVASSPHPTAMALLGKDGLLVTLSNEDRVAVVDTTFNTVAGYLPTRLPNQTIAGSYPNALAVSANPARIFVADASSDAIAVYDASGIKNL